MSECPYCQNTFEMTESCSDEFRMWQGLVGPYYIPSVDESGVLSWTNTGDLPNPDSIDIKGPAGDAGITPDVAVTPITGGHNVAFDYGTGDQRNKNFNVLDGISKAFTVTLAAANWISEIQTVSSAEFLTGDYIYLVSPAPDSLPDYCMAQAYAGDVLTAGQMTFYCTTAPETNLTVNIVRVVSS